MAREQGGRCRKGGRSLDSKIPTEDQGENTKVSLKEEMGSFAILYNKVYFNATVGCWHRDPPTYPEDVTQSPVLDSSMCGISLDGRSPCHSSNS